METWTVIGVLMAIGANLGGFAFVAVRLERRFNRIETQNVYMKAYQHRLRSGLLRLARCVVKHHKGK